MGHYQLSQYKVSLQQSGLSISSSSTPEMAIAADLKRIVSVLPVDKRKQIGFFVCSLLGLRGSKSQDTIENLIKRKEENQKKIEELEERLAELQASKQS